VGLWCHGPGVRRPGEVVVHRRPVVMVGAPLCCLVQLPWSYTRRNREVCWIGNKMVEKKH
jgi:hypothetical protein